MINPAEYVRDPQFHELPPRVVPGRIELHDASVPVISVDALLSIRRNSPQYHVGLDAESGKARVDGEARSR